MPPTKGKGRGAGGSASGSRSQSRRGRAPLSRPTPGVTTRARAAHREPSPSLAEKSGNDEGSSSKKQKKTNASSQENAAAGSASAAASQEVTAAAPSSQENAAAGAASAAGSQEETAAAPSSQENAAAGSTSAAARQEETLVATPPDDAASDVSSPIRVPDMVMEPWDVANISPYQEESAKYQAKLDREYELLSLDDRGPTTCLDDEESLFPVRESVTQMVFQTAKSILGLTSYIDGNLLKRCSGFLIGWNEYTKCGTILTSANLLCTKTPNIDSWSCPREYAPDAEVKIHLLDDTTQKGTLINYHKHYNIALFEVDMNMSTELPPVSEQLVDYGQEVFLIGRDEKLNLNASYGRVQYIDRGYYNHNHYMYLEREFAKFGDGGPAIDRQGRIVGMANPTSEAAFIPHLFTLKCLRMWKDFKCVPWLHFGLKIKSVQFLMSFTREKMSRKFNIDAGLVAKEVSEGSAAEKIGIRNGDVIESLNGKCIPTVVELEMLLLSTCEHFLDNGGVLGSNVDLMVGLFEMRKQKRCTKTLTLNVSDDMEVIAKGRYPVSAALKNSVDMSSRQETSHLTSDREFRFVIS